MKLALRAALNTAPAPRGTLPGASELNVDLLNFNVIFGQFFVKTRILVVFKFPQKLPVHGMPVRTQKTLIPI